MAVSSRGDLFARIMGFLVFILGVAIILMTMRMALGLWNDPNLGFKVAPGGASPALVNVGLGFGRLLIRIILLFLISICGSQIANKGVHLYFTAIQSPRES